MKKFFAIFLAVLMLLSMTACKASGGNETTAPKGNTSTTGAPAETTNAPAESTGATESTSGGSEVPTDATEGTVAPPVDAEPLPENPLVYLNFDNTDGLKAVALADGNVINDSEHPILLAEGQGAAGNALYLDGKYGVDFSMPAIDDDSYTISFWYNADRLATYGPVVTMGRNMAGTDTSSPVTWISFTKAEWGTGSVDIFPVVWNRNSSIGTEVNPDGVWPWIGCGDDLVHGKREWALVTLVVDGSRYVADDGMERIADKLYLNGNLMFEANAENMFYQGVAPEIFKGGNVEAHIGVNYWDTMFKGFIDELYIFDEPLTAGQVKTLFENGNPPATPVAPEYEG